MRPGCRTYPLLSWTVLALALLVGDVATAQDPGGRGPPPPGHPPPHRAGHPPPPREPMPPPGQESPQPSVQPAPLQLQPVEPPATLVEVASPALLHLQTARQSGNQDDIGEALVAYAVEYTREARAAKALPLLDEAVAIANATGNDRLGREASIAAADAHEQLGDRDMERTWLDQAERYRDRIANRFAPPPIAERPAQARTATSEPAPAPPPAPASPPREPVRWPSAAWLLAPLALLPLWAWIRSYREAERLGSEAERLARHQRQLRTANSALQEQAERLRQAAVQDALTGALSRNAFARQLEEVLLHAGHYGKPVALMVFDLDHFKNINDSQGHLAGDAALKMVAGIVRENLGSDDLFGRFGGDEFLIACADLDRPAALALAEKIRIAVHERAGAESQGSTRLSLSLGIAHADPGSGYRSELLFSRADAALYAAKRGGRNRSVLEDPATPSPPRDQHVPRSLASAPGGA